MSRSSSSSTTVHDTDSDAMRACRVQSEHNRRLEGKIRQARGALRRELRAGPDVWLTADVAERRKAILAADDRLRRAVNSAGPLAYAGQELRRASFDTAAARASDADAERATGELQRMARLRAALVQAIDAYRCAYAAMPKDRRASPLGARCARIIAAGRANHDGALEAIVAAFGPPDDHPPAVQAAASAYTAAFETMLAAAHRVIDGDADAWRGLRADDDPAVLEVLALEADAKGHRTALLELAAQLAPDNPRLTLELAGRFHWDQV